MDDNNFKNKPRFDKDKVSTRLWLLIMAVIVITALIVVFISSRVKVPGKHQWVIFAAIVIIFIGSFIYVNFRNLRDLKKYIQDLKISANIPHLWGGVIGGFRTVRGTYQGRKVLLGTEGDEEDISIRFPFTKHFQEHFFITSDNRTIERITSMPLFEKWHEHRLPKTNKSYQIIRYTARGKILQVIIGSGLFEKLSEAIDILAPYLGHFYINQREVKLKFPTGTVLEEDVMQAGCRVYDSVLNL